jgi:hypothetical protein
MVAHVRSRIVSPASDALIGALHLRLLLDATETVCLHQAGPAEGRDRSFTVKRFVWGINY